ncbi:hypothetical protein LJC56_09395 [Christensenellaceae bacterium OttesenSCG-928-K19]|nr:hypothetical protein [Christensenellaceae bacterium OttesenSCG-928-K19]
MAFEIKSNYHARYYAYLLTHPEAYGIKRYMPALLNSAIELHPHQLDASIFAQHNAYGGGAILADEEGLGKTIEAGIVLSQLYYEGKRRLLVLVPPDYVDHWKENLEERFLLPTITINEYPEQEGIVLASYTDVVQQEQRFTEIAWDIAVIDEAHRLANASALTSEHKTSDAIYRALKGRYKLMLTATPMQRLLDLFYLIRFADDTVFGSDVEVFKKQYIENNNLKDELASRAQQICYRTLRQNALTMRQTKRIAYTIAFEPRGKEITLSKNLSLFLHRENLQSFPKIQSHYIRLTLYKLLSSSPQALLATLEKVYTRLSKLPDAHDEMRELKSVMELAASIPVCTKFEVFLKSLKESLAIVRKSGAARKAVVFVENKVTLSCLKDYLEEKGIKTAQYGTAKAEAAFKDDAVVMLCTQKGSERPDFSHASLIINYDLPWNAMKMEQRIARLQRYGQKHDVLVVNLVDPTNRSDRRNWTLINKKLRIFDDTFGTSDTLLGELIDSKEKLDTDVLRKKKEIKEDMAAFEESHADEIYEETHRAAAELLSRFDEQVINRFKLHEDTVKTLMPEMDEWLWSISKHMLRNKAMLKDEDRSIIIQNSPYKGLRLSGIIFKMDRSAMKSQRYRLDHPLAQRVLDDAMYTPLYGGRMTIEAGNGFAPGDSGCIGMWTVTALSSRIYQSFPVLCGFDKQGHAITQEQCRSLMEQPMKSCTAGERYVDDETGEEIIYDHVHENDRERLQTLFQQAKDEKQKEILIDTNEQLQAEIGKLKRFAEDEAMSLKLKADNLQAHIASLKKKVEQTSSFQDRFAMNKEMADARGQAQRLEQEQFLATADIEQQVERRIEQVREQAEIRFMDSELFMLQYTVV